MRTRRIFSNTAVHKAPKLFLVVVVMADSEPPLSFHLVCLLFSAKVVADVL